MKIFLIAKVYWGLSLSFGERCWGGARESGLLHIGPYLIGLSWSRTCAS